MHTQCLSFVHALLLTIYWPRTGGGRGAVFLELKWLARPVPKYLALYLLLNLTGTFDLSTGVFHFCMNSAYNTSIQGDTKSNRMSRHVYVRLTCTHSIKYIIDELFFFFKEKSFDDIAAVPRPTTRFATTFQRKYTYAHKIRGVRS